MQKDATEAQKIGLGGTPSFFLNGRFFTGALQYQDLRQMVLQRIVCQDKDKDKDKSIAAKQGQ